MGRHSSGGRFGEGAERRWTGFYTYDTGARAGTKYDMDLYLVMEDGRIRGRGSDVEVGSFDLDGTFHPGGNEVEFLKRYSNRSNLRYSGFYEEGYGIWGNWRYVRSGTRGSARSRGAFHLWRRGSNRRGGNRPEKRVDRT